MVPKIIKMRSCEGKHTITETFLEHIVTGGINSRWNCGVFRKKQQCLSKCKSDWRKWTDLDTSVLHLFEKREWNLSFLLFHFSSQKGNDQEKHVREAICITIFLLSHCLCLLAESVLLVNVIWEIVGVYLRHSTVFINTSFCYLLKQDISTSIFNLISVLCIHILCKSMWTCEWKLSTFHL